MKNLFDNDYIKTNDLSFRYGVISMLALTILVIILSVLKKDYYYQNVISFTDKDKGLLIVEKKYINHLKECNELFINDMNLFYNIEKIEEIENAYYVHVKFDYDVDKISAVTYKIIFHKENYISYIIRIIKGEK